MSGLSSNLVRRGRVALCVVGLGLLAAGSAPAQQAPAAEAPGARVDVSASSASAVSRARIEALDLGLQAYFRKRWAAAIDLLSAAPEGERSPLQWLYLARAQTSAGKLVDAVDSYARLVSLRPEPKEEKSAAWQTLRRRALVERGQVEGRLGWARIRVDEALPPRGLILVDGQEISRQSLLDPHPVDPGWHRFLAVVGGEVWAAERLHFDEGQQRSARLAPNSSRLARRAPQPAAGDRALREDRQPKLLGYTGLALGVGGGLAAGLFGVRAAAASQDRDLVVASLCDDARCPESLRTVVEGLREDARTARRWAAVSGVIAGLGIVGGTALLVISHGGRGRELRASLGPASLTVEGSF